MAIRINLNACLVLANATKFQDLKCHTLTSLMKGTMIESHPRTLHCVRLYSLQSTPQCHHRVTELQLCPVTFSKKVQKNQGSGIELLPPGAGLQGDLPARQPREEAI